MLSRIGTEQLIKAALVGVALFAVFFGSDLSLVSDSGAKDAITSAIDAIVSAGLALVLQALRTSDFTGQGKYQEPP